LGKARARGLVDFAITQIRDFATDRHKSVDDKPYGGGAGMLLRVDILHAAWKSVVSRKSKTTRTILLSPQGPLLTQTHAKRLAKYKKIVFVCGHYEGVDERFVDLCVDEELSIGDYVLTGGELPAMVATDVIARLVAGVVGRETSVSGDSLEGGLLKYPQYTRPRIFEGLDVPKILLSGDHRRIEAWRQEQALTRTKRKRPDLIGPGSN